MSKTIQTNFRLTEAARNFLKHIGGGDISQGLETVLIKAGFNEIERVVLHRSKYMNMPGVYAYYKTTGSVISSMTNVEATDCFLEENIGRKSLGVLHTLVHLYYGDKIDFEKTAIDVIEDGKLVWSSDGSHLL